MGYNLSAGNTVAAADLEQIYRAAGPYAADGQASDAYAITTVPAPASLNAGMVFQFKANTANTGAATLNVNGLGAKTIKKNVSDDLETGDILAGQMVTVMYDGTNFQLLSRASKDGGLYASGIFTKDVSDASTTQEIAHGLARPPKFVRFTWHIGSGTGAHSAQGVYNGTVVSTLYWDENGTTQQTDATYVIYYKNGVGVEQKATITVDATNINLTWTKNGSPTGTITVMWETFA